MNVRTGSIQGEVVVVRTMPAGRTARDVEAYSAPYVTALPLKNAPNKGVL